MTRVAHVHGHLREVGFSMRLGFGLWACLPDPKRALGAHGVPRIGEARLRRTALTPNHAVRERGIHLLVRTCLCWQVHGARGTGHARNRKWVETLYWKRSCVGSV